MHSEPSLLAVLRAVAATHNISASHSARAYNRAAPLLPAATENGRNSGTPPAPKALGASGNAVF